MAIRKTFIAAALCTLGVIHSVWAGPQSTYEFNLPQQSLAEALRAIGRQTTMNILFEPGSVESMVAPAVQGTLSAEEAIRRVIAGKNLVVQEMAGNSVVVATVNSIGKLDGNGHLAGKSQRCSGLSSNKLDSVTTLNQTTSDSTAIGWTTLEGGSDCSSENSQRNQRLASADAGVAGESVQNSDGESSLEKDSTSKPVLQEVVVTAQKREERLQDVPVPVQVVSADTLRNNDEPRLRDFYDSIVGLVVSPTSVTGNEQMLSIRGISSGAYGNPTVGIIIDDVPFGAFARELAPDVDPSDLARLEVLRGPQGALYGASSMGGLLKFVTTDPSTSEFSGRMQADINGVYHGTEPGYAFRGAVNVPLSDVFAIRASAFTRQDAGYIDNPVRDINGINEAHDSGGRLAALWRPSDSFSMKVSAIYQKATADGNNDIFRGTGLGDLQQNYLPGAGSYDTTIQAYSAILNGKLGDVSLISVTGYNEYKYTNSEDFTYAFGDYSMRFFGVPGALLNNVGESKTFSQEVRASIPIGQKFEWLIGGFYTHENIPLQQNIYAETLAGEVAGNLAGEFIPIKHTEYAGFTDLTIHMTDRFDVQVGGRESRLEENFEAVSNDGAFFNSPPDPPFVVPAINTTHNVFTYLVTPKFQISPNLMVYSRIASGYRPGRSNSFTFAVNPAIPPAASPDKTQNYEIGMKGDILDHALSFDASLYYIDFKNIQIDLVDATGNDYFDNGGNAKSEGVELSVQYRLPKGLTLAGWATYDNAVLTENFPANTAAVGLTGDRLPYSSRFSSHMSINKDLPLTTSITGFAGVEFSYVGDRLGPFTASGVRQDFPAYTKLDLRTGINSGPWLFNVYINNATDRRGVVGGGIGNIPPQAFLYIQPRTVGMTIVRTF